MMEDKPSPFVVNNDRLIVLRTFMENSLNEFHLPFEESDNSHDSIILTGVGQRIPVGLNASSETADCDLSIRFWKHSAMLRFSVAPDPAHLCIHLTPSLLDRKSTRLNSSHL